MITAESGGNRRKKLCYTSRRFGTETGRFVRLQSIYLFCAFFGLLFFWTAAWCAPLPIKDYREVLPAIHRLVEKYGAENVLFATDYDNTLAQTPTALGSEPWFEALIKEKGHERYREIILLQLAIFHKYPTQLVQPEIPSAIREIQSLGVKTMLLTSRNRYFADITERDLKTLGIDLGKNTVPAANLPKRSFQLMPDNDRKVLFMGGMFFTAGLPKGHALSSLLNTAGWKPKAVVFIDDREKHVHSIEETFGKSEDIETVTFRYGLTDEKLNNEWEQIVTKRSFELRAIAGELRRFIKAKHRNCHELLDELSR